jgi:threonine aldolase
MRRAMAEAEVGDDVYGEDPTVNRLQARAAEIFEREAALFVPSGSMGNLISVMCWTRPGMEVICDERGHINVYELASISAIAGCLPRAVAAPDGILTWDLIEPVLAPNVYYRAPTGLISLENTSNRHSGNFYPPETLADICDHAHALGVPVHLDAARIFNAAVALGRTVADITRKCDSVMSCLSKGLGAPVGSLLLGSKDFIAKARVKRKMLGGGMRQAGILAAAGLVALEESPQQLHVDHENARHLADNLAQLAGFRLDPQKIRTNIVIFDVEGTGRTAAEISAALAEQGILCGAISKYGIRMVTHHDVDRAGIDRALAACKAIATHKPVPAHA